MKCDYCRTYAKGERCPNCGAPRLSPDWADMSATDVNLDLSSCGACINGSVTSITSINFDALKVADWLSTVPYTGPCSDAAGPP